MGGGERVEPFPPIDAQHLCLCLSEIVQHHTETCVCVCTVFKQEGGRNDNDIFDDNIMATDSVATLTDVARQEARAAWLTITPAPAYGDGVCPKAQFWDELASAIASDTTVAAWLRERTRLIVRPHVSGATPQQALLQGRGNARNILGALATSTLPLDLVRATEFAGRPAEWLDSSAYSDVWAWITDHAVHWQKSASRVVSRTAMPLTDNMVQGQAPHADAIKAMMDGEYYDAITEMVAITEVTEATLATRHTALYGGVDQAGRHVGMSKAQKTGAFAVSTLKKPVRTANETEGANTETRQYENFTGAIQASHVHVTREVLRQGAWRAGSRRVTVEQAAEAAELVYRLDIKALDSHLHLFSSHDDVTRNKTTTDKMRDSDLTDALTGYFVVAHAIWGPKVGKDAATRARNWVESYLRLDGGATYPGGRQGIYRFVTLHIAQFWVDSMRDELRGGEAAHSMAMVFSDEFVGTKWRARMMSYEQRRSYLLMLKESGSDVASITSPELLWARLMGSTIASPGGSTCHKCGLPGHKARKCPTGGGGGKGDEFDGTCDKCGKRGHRKADCRSRDKGDRDRHRDRDRDRDRDRGSSRKDRGKDTDGGSDRKRPKTDKNGKESFADALHACQDAFRETRDKVGKGKACLFSSCCKEGCSLQAADCNERTRGGSSHAKEDQLTADEAAQYVKTKEVCQRVAKGTDSSHTGMRRIHDKHDLPKIADDNA